jgi:hypothetical protein
MATEANVPKPGPAKLGSGAGIDEWLEQAKQCRYLPESAMKELCEKVKECLIEGVNIDMEHGKVLTLYRVQHPTGSHARHYLW